ncbi:DUF3800 domain-containing protein [Cytophagaceae bacterium DM2B3-1]|uniref:DUF3800 domain-containing protein n=1 Tax=Xanthocytophaga flava TaxID=3048013 RepID=A0ABT7CYP0_9BACT|nr:DUF3800 domain-containing protein [Xanthocytophaga flavus]MDJ1498886.1 DUF3800 domain-containing protein [Xanthocytophaga flavus]
MKTANIYIDEFGNTHLDLSKTGTFSHFVYTSVIIDKEDVGKARELRERLTKDFKLGPDIKSSNIKDKHFDKRLNILTELVTNLDFNIDVLVVDKSKIESQGLKYKQVFYKYFQSLFVTKYNDKYESYSIWADKVGEEFKDELNEYVIHKSIQRDLFHPDRSFQIADDKSGEKLIQLADFVSGCVGKIFCTSHAHERARDIYNIIHTRIAVEYFPFDSVKHFITPEESTLLDEQIQEMNFEIIQKYLENAPSAINKEKTRLLEYLSLQNRINPERLTPTHELAAYMSNFFPNYSSEKVRMLVRDLRYEGLFVVSHSGKPGYKLANSYYDISEHFTHFLKYIIPMLQKIKILNSTISSNSFNKINPIEKDPNMLKLKELLAGFN